MRKAIYALGAASLGLLAAAGSAPPAEALIIYPWCAHYNGRGGGGAPSCGFVTFQQCMATVSGTQGTCEVNPWWNGPPPQIYSQSPRRGPSRY
jgi:hypothetical protein